MGIAGRAKEEIPFIVGYAAVKFSGNVIDSFGDEIEMDGIVERVKNIVKEYLQIYKILGEYTVGMPKEILMSTSEIFILVRIFYNDELFQVAVLKSDANLGYTRYMLHQFSLELSKV